MRPVDARLPDRCAVPLLLRPLEVHASVRTVLCACLFDAGGDPNAGAQSDTNLSTTAAVPMPAGLRKGVRE